MRNAYDITTYDPPVTLSDLISLLDGRELFDADWVIEFERDGNNLIASVRCRDDADMPTTDLPLVSATFPAATRCGCCGERPIATDFTLHQVPVGARTDGGAA